MILISLVWSVLLIIKMGLGALDVSLYAFFGILTILFSGLIIMTYLANKDLQQHPSSLIAVLSVFEILMAYHSIIFAVGSDDYADITHLSDCLGFLLGHSVEQRLLDNAMCYANQFILASGVVGVLCGNIAICIDLIITLRNPFVSGKKRAKYYYAIEGIVICYFTVYLCFVNDFISVCHGNGMNFRLEVLNLASISILLMIYFLCACFSCVYAGIRFSRGLHLDTQETRMYFVRHVGYVVVFLVLWSWPALSYVLRSFFNTRSHIIDQIAISTVSATGVCLGVIRCSDPLLWKKLKSFTFISNKEIVSEDVWNRPLSAVVSSNLSGELARLLFVALHSVYETHLVEDKGENQNKKRKRDRTHYIQDYLKYSVELYGTNTENVPGLKVNEYGEDMYLDIIRRTRHSLEELAESMQPDLNESSYTQVSETAGKSGSFLLFTADRKFAIKTIKPSEKVTLRKFLEKYHEHLKKHHKSILCQIYGLFTIKVPGITPIHIIVMENVQYQLEVIQVFDIKGSMRGRTNLSSGVRSGPLKDLDFSTLETELDMSDNDIEGLSEAIACDIACLGSFKLIDYSLLLTICRDTSASSPYTFKSVNSNVAYSFAIIDYLTHYSYWKFIEETFSSPDASVKKPNDYANRFVNFIFSEVFGTIRRYSSLSRQIEI